MRSWGGAGPGRAAIGCACPAPRSHWLRSRASRPRPPWHRPLSARVTVPRTQGWQCPGHGGTMPRTQGWQCPEHGDGCAQNTGMAVTCTRRGLYFLHTGLAVPRTQRWQCPAHGGGCVPHTGVLSPHWAVSLPPPLCTYRVLPPLSAAPPLSPSIPFHTPECTRLQRCCTPRTLLHTLRGFPPLFSISYGMLTPPPHPLLFHLLSASHVLFSLTPWALCLPHTPLHTDRQHTALLSRLKSPFPLPPHRDAAPHSCPRYSSPYKCCLTHFGGSNDLGALLQS